MNNKKKTILAAAFVVAVIALAGVGYAFTLNFQGTTSTTAKTADVDFVKISLSADNYSQTVIPYDVSAVYWQSVTDANGTVYNNPTPVNYTYAVTIDPTSLEGGDLLRLTISGLTAPSGYTLSYTCDSTDQQSFSEGVLTIGTDSGAQKSTFDLAFNLVVTLTPSPDSITSTSAAPATPPQTAVFPALTFLLEGQNGEAPAAS